MFQKTSFINDGGFLLNKNPLCKKSLITQNEKSDDKGEVILLETNIKEPNGGRLF